MQRLCIDWNGVFTMGVFYMSLLICVCRLKLFNVVVELLVYCYFGFGFATV